MPDFSQFIPGDFRQNLLALVFKLEVSLQVFVYGVRLNIIFHDGDFAALHGFVEQVEGGVEQVGVVDIGGGARLLKLAD